MKYLQRSLVGALALVLLSIALLPPVYMATITPAQAQSCATVERVSAELTQEGVKYQIISDPVEVAAFISKLNIALNLSTPLAPDAFTRIVVADLKGDGALVFGVEDAGCLAGPYVLPFTFEFVPVALKLSGKYPFGTFA